MFGIIMAVIFVIAGIAIGIYLIMSELKGAGITAILVGIVAAVVSVIIASCTSIPTGYTGIVTTFGRVENTTLDAGIHMKAPWQNVIKMDNRIQKETIELSCFSSDIQEVNVVYTINYQIDKENAMNIYRTIGKSYYETAVLPNVSETVKTVVARYTAENLIESRAELALAIEELLAEALSNYNIQIASTAIEDMDFSDAFTNAVEAKQVAAQNKLQAEIEQEQKTMEQQATAERSVIEAEAAAEVAKIQAQADLEVTKIEADAAEYAGQKEASKNKAITESLTDALINYYYIQQWNGQLPNSYVGSDSVNAIVGID